MSSRRDNVQPLPDREHLPEEFAAMGLPTDDDDTRIIINLKEGHTAARAAFRLLFRPHILIPALLGAAAERVARSVRNHTVAAAVVGTAAAVTVVAGASAFALASNDQPLAVPPAAVERVTLPPVPGVTHTVIETAIVERTITLPPAIVETGRPARQEPTSRPDSPRPAPRPPARPSPKAKPSANPPTTQAEQPSPTRPATSPSATSQPPAEPPPRPATRPPADEPTNKPEAEPTQKPETPASSQAPETPDSPKPNPSPDQPTSKPCTIHIGLGGIKLCVSL